MVLQVVSLRSWTIDVGKTISVRRIKQVESFIVDRLVRCCEVCAVHLIYPERIQLDCKAAGISRNLCHVDFVSTAIACCALTIWVANRASWAWWSRAFLWAQCWKVGSLTILNYFGIATIYSERTSIYSEHSRVLRSAVIRARCSAISVWKTLLTWLIKEIVKCIVRSRSWWDQSTIDGSYL